MGQSKLRMCESRKRVELARFIWKWMFWNVWNWMFGSCYLKVDVWNVWKWMFGSCYLKVNVRNVWKDKLKLKILTTECYLFLIARLPHIEDLTNTFNTYFYTMQKYLLCGQKWSKRCLIHESRVCLSGASAYQQVHFQRIQRIKVHGCFLHPDKVKLPCLRNR